MINRCQRYGEDHYLVGEFGTSYVKTMQELDDSGYTKVACTVKHFVYGQSSGGINAASQYGGINRIMNEQAMPFIKVVKNANPYSLMASYSAVDRVPMAANKYMLQTVLRNTIGFQGIVMSDAGAISELHSLHLIASSATNAAVKALSAGIELELSPAQPATFPSLIDSVNDSAIVSLVNDAVQKLLEIKFLTGTFDEPLPTLQALNATLRKESHLRVARNASEEAIVLLQNDGILPLSDSRAPNSSNSIAVLGPLADLLVMGSYAPNNSTQPLHGKPFVQALKDYLGADNVNYVPGVDVTNTSDSSGISSAVSTAKQAGLAVVCLGSVSVLPEDGAAKWRTDGEFFSHPSLGFPGLQQDLLDAVLDSGVPTVLVMAGGQAFALSNSTVDRTSAILHSFLAGEFTGEALVDILYGNVNPSAKLPITLPPHSGATPIYYDYLPSDVGAYWSWPVLDRANPPFKFGYGLSYTTFEFSELEASITSGGSNLSVSVTLSNTGSVSGKEVAQVYFRQQYTAIETPNKQLIRFTKVELSPGEKTKVNWTITHEELGYWQDMEYIVDSGNFTFWIGSSSREEDLEAISVGL